MGRYFDVIVVGAGPAGSMAALKLARAGLSVALLERGTRPGSKNMFGGLIHNTPVLNEIFPRLWEEAPLERHVYKKTLAFMTPTSCASMTFETEDFLETPYNGCTVMRPVFDSWLANEAVKAGATLLCNCTAENLVRKGERITGVSVKGRAGELNSNIVIAADGILSFMAEQAGLRMQLRPVQLGLGVKLLLGLPREVINERFNLVRDEGADLALLGIPEGLHGGAFLYTNAESISIGLVAHLESLKALRKTPYDLLNNTMQHPMVRKLIKGAVPMEYSAHLIAEGGIKAMPRIYTAGMMLVGDAAGLCYANGINLEGVNLAMTSGALAAECAIEATKEKDFSAQRLSAYKRGLDDSFVVKDMETFKSAPDMMGMDRLYRTYPQLICRILEKMYRVEGTPRHRLFRLIRKEAAGKVSMRDLISDGIKVRRALL